jgi:hypothetical protein
VVGFFGGNNWSIRGKGKVNSGIWDQVGLELSNIDVQGSVESQRGSQRGTNLGDQSVQVGVGWSFNIQLSSADIVNGFIVHHESDISVLQQGVSGQDRVVWLDDSGGNLRGWVNTETQFGFFSVID